MTQNVLQKIADQTTQDIAALPFVDVNTLKCCTCDFVAAVTGSGFGVIAEIKYKSPSAGVLIHDKMPALVAESYVKYGVQAISVLTDETFFGGSFDHVREVVQAVDVPVLCKAFVLDVKQIHHARQAGASAVLLIMRILSDEQYQALYAEIERLGMTPLVEVFDEADIKRALTMNPKLIGINNRNLDTLEMDVNNSERLRPCIPAEIKVLSLSGVKTPADIEQRKAYSDGVLVGTAFLQGSL
jgi:indole-3-glycerol phosphate synthase